MVRETSFKWLKDRRAGCKLLVHRGFERRAWTGAMRLFQVGMAIMLALGVLQSWRLYERYEDIHSRQVA